MKNSNDPRQTMTLKETRAQKRYVYYYNILVKKLEVIMKKSINKNLTNNVTYQNRHKPVCHKHISYNIS